MPGFLAEVLHKPHNRGYRIAVATARAWGVPPHVTISGGVPGEWSEQDVLLANALTVLENETCKSCGTPVWLGYSTDNEILFRTQKSHCYGCEELEKEREKQTKAKQKGYGDTTYVEPYHFFENKGGRLPSRRESLTKNRK